MLSHGNLDGNRPQILKIVKKTIANGLLLIRMSMVWKVSPLSVDSKNGSRQFWVTGCYDSIKTILFG